MRNEEGKMDQEDPLFKFFAFLPLVSHLFVVDISFLLQSNLSISLGVRIVWNHVHAAYST